MTNRVPAEVFPPGEFIREELEARGWTQGDLAAILGRPLRLVNELIAGKKLITPETAKGLGLAFGTGAMFWMNVESAYRLSRSESVDETVSRRARLYSRFPVRELIKRGWIERSDNYGVLEHRVLSFYNIASIDEPLDFAHAAKAVGYEERTRLQLAWLYRAKQLAESVSAASYSEPRLREAVERLRMSLEAPEEIRHVPRLLAEAGVRLVIVEFLPGSKIDGATFWLSGKEPVIALSLRFDRIDHFWFVLRHEIEHILQGDGKENMILDEDIIERRSGDQSPLPTKERLANQAAEHFLVPREELNDFISRIRPLYYEKRIVLFAKRIGVHPGLVIGQLHWREEIPYTHLKKYLVKVRHLIAESAMTDGWGHAPAISSVGGE